MLHEQVTAFFKDALIWCKQNYEIEGKSYWKNIEKRDELKHKLVDLMCSKQELNNRKKEIRSYEQLAKENARNAKKFKKKKRTKSGSKRSWEKPMKTNKKTGNSFERELCQKLFEKGFWVHNLTQSQTGQPADIIAVRNGFAFLIDCKVCENDTFPLSRIEGNQHSAMTLWSECGNGTGWFALKLSDGVVRMLPYSVIKTLVPFVKSLSRADIIFYGESLGRWKDVIR